jgi:hypothetical protein
MPPVPGDLERSRARNLSRTTRWTYEHPTGWALINGVTSGLFLGLLDAFLVHYDPAKASASGLVALAIGGSITYVSTRHKAKRWRQLAA